MKRRKFNLGSFANTTGDMGYVIPIQFQEVLAGDTFMGGSEVFFRMSPMLAPIMHPIIAEIQHFFVPYRIIWDDFEDFVTKNNEQLYYPKMQVYKNDAGSLLDYLGIPPFPQQTPLPRYYTSLPVRAYVAIWNRYYRDQDLQDEIPIDTSTTQDDRTPANLLRACWKKDYFTISRPWEQKGEEVLIPVYSTGITQQFIKFTIEPVPGSYVRGCSKADPTGDKPPTSYEIQNLDAFRNRQIGETQLCQVATGQESPCQNLPLLMQNVTFSVKNMELVDVHADPVYNLQTSLIPSTEAEFSLTGEVTFVIAGVANGVMSISDIRAGIAEQRLKERKAKWGSQYRDLLASYGINYQDARLQEPELITGGSNVLRISEVVQTGAGNDDPIGTLKGYGLGLGRSNKFKRFFQEHGIFLTLLCVRPINMYGQSVPRYFLKNTSDDIFQREISQLVPLQEIKTEELYVEAPMNQNFGYIDRYDEYRYTQSRIHGEFHTHYDHWHLARMFEKTPVLNGDFLTCTPTKRIFAEQTTHTLIMQVQNMLRARRLLPSRAKTGAL